MTFIIMVCLIMVYFLYVMSLCKPILSEFCDQLGFSTLGFAVLSKREMDETWVEEGVQKSCSLVIFGKMFLIHTH